MLILKVVNASGEWRVASGEEDLGGAVTPLSRVFAHEWQGKDLQKGIFALRCNGRHEGVLPHRVFCKKRLQAVENKGWEPEKESKEAPGD